MEYLITIDHFTKTVVPKSIYRQNFIIEGKRFELQIIKRRVAYVFTLPIGWYNFTHEWVLLKNSDAQYQFEQMIFQKVQQPELSEFECVVLCPVVESFLAEDTLMLAVYTPVRPAVHRYLNLWNDTDYGDIQVVVGTEVVRLHKCILGRASPVLCTLLDTEEYVSGLPMISFPFSSSVVTTFLKYVYQGSTALDTIDDSDVDNLWHMASQYKVSQLVALCEEKLASRLTHNNCLVMLKSSVDNKQPFLKRKILDYVRVHANALIKAQKLNIFDVFCREDALDLLDQM